MHSLASFLFCALRGFQILHSPIRNWHCAPPKACPEPGRIGDAQRLLRIEEEAPLKEQKIVLLEQRVSNLEKENDLLKQQNAIQEKLTELAKKEAEVYRSAFEKEKELTDRALKLAEVVRPKSNWELQGVLGLAAFVLGFLLGR